MHWLKTKASKNIDMHSQALFYGYSENHDVNRFNHRPGINIIGYSFTFADHTKQKQLHIFVNKSFHY